MEIATQRETSIHDRIDDLDKTMSETRCLLDTMVTMVCGDQVPSDPTEVSLGAHGRLAWLCEQSARNMMLARRLNELCGVDPRLAPDVMPSDARSDSMLTQTAEDRFRPFGASR